MKPPASIALFLAAAAFGLVTARDSVPVAKGSVFHDLDGDGVKDFIGIEDDFLRLVSGKTGEVTAETELPKTGPYCGFRGESMGKYLHKCGPLWPLVAAESAEPDSRGASSENSW